MAKKSIVIALLIVVLTLVMTLQPLQLAHADVIVEPDDDFYRRNRQDMKYMGRSFYANGENGYIKLLVEPNSVREVISIANGEIVYIMYTYSDNGVLWGVTEVNINGWVTVWILMDDLNLVYDSIEFASDHGSEFVERDFNIGELDFDGDLILWTWPGSGEISWVFERQYLMGDTNMGEGSTIYIDMEGREWGYLGYFYGSRSIWVCLDDPSNQNIPAFNPAPTPDLQTRTQPPATQGDTREPNAQSGDDDIRITNPDSQSSANSGNMSGQLSSPMLVITLVSLVAMLSLVLIRLLWKKEPFNFKKDDTGEGGNKSGDEAGQKSNTEAGQKSDNDSDK